MTHSFGPATIRSPGWHLADVFASWVYQRDAAKVIAAYRAVDSPGNDNGYAVYSAVQCTDAQWPSQWSTWERDNWRVYRAAPFATWLNAWFNAPCLFWPAKAGTPVQVDGGPVPALLVDETLDAATPYPGSIEVRRRFPRARLLAEPGGTTHAGTLSGNTCVDDTIAAYLATGALPNRRAGDQADAICPPLPQPVPTTASNTVPSPRGRTPTGPRRSRVDKPVSCLSRRNSAPRSRGSVSRWYCSTIGAVLLAGLWAGLAWAADGRWPLSPPERSPSR